MKDYKWYKDWLNWFTYIVIAIVVCDFIRYYDTLVRWKWGYYSIDLIPSYLILIMAWSIYDYVLNGRRWKWINQQLNELVNKK